MSKELRPVFYYCIRRKWYNQLISSCDSAIAKKGKEPVTMFWRAFGMGMTGDISGCLRELDAFHSRKDLQYPVNLAMQFFQKRAPEVDREAIRALASEASLAEDVAKEAGFILAARFQLFTGNWRECRRLCRKLLDQARGADSNSTTVFEAEAAVIEQWCNLEEGIQAASSIADIRQVASSVYESRGRWANNGDQDPDTLLLLARALLEVRKEYEALNYYNIAISKYPAFLPALGDKALLLACAGDWEQALDAAQRLLDVEADHIDGLLIIAVHAFTQEGASHDAVQKLEDLDAALRKKEPVGVTLPYLQAATLFSRICGRQPRTLQLCITMLERCFKTNKRLSSKEEECRLLTTIGEILSLQGPSFVDKASNIFREATKRDPQNPAPLLGLIRLQLVEGAMDEAESQIELLGLMHNLEELGHEMLFIQALLPNTAALPAESGGREGKNQKKQSNEQRKLTLLQQCKQVFLDGQRSSTNKSSLAGAGSDLAAFHALLQHDPDFAMMLAMEFIKFVDCSVEATTLVGAGGAATGTTGSSLLGTAAVSEPVSEDSSAADAASAAISAETTVALSEGLELLKSALSSCPGLLAGYMEEARVLYYTGKFDEAMAALQQGLEIQPQSAPLLLSMALIEVSRNHTSSAHRLVEQALAADFNIRPLARFKFIRAMVKAQQGLTSEALSEMESVMSMPEFGYSPAVSTAAAAEEAMQHGPLEGGSSGHSNYSDLMRLTPDDKVAAYVAYASLLSRERRLKEANRVLSHAKALFAGLPQEVQVLSAAANLHVTRGDYDTAVRMLDKIDFTSTAFSRAMVLKANILLVHNHDREGYIGCFQKLVEGGERKNPMHLLLLAEGYLRILNPEMAIDIFEEAYRLDPQDKRLRARIGHTLIVTHEYHRAVEFYESGIRQILAKLAEQRGAAASGASSAVVLATEDLALVLDLAALYTKLGRLESSARVLNDLLSATASSASGATAGGSGMSGNTNSATATAAAKQRVQILSELANVHEVSEAHEKMQVVLQEARNLQRDVLLRSRSSTSTAAAAAGGMGGSGDDEKSQLAKLCVKLGHALLLDGEVQEAERCYDEAVTANPASTSALLGLAQCALRRGEFERCQLHCQKVLTAAEQQHAATLQAMQLQQQTQLTHIKNTSSASSALHSASREAAILLSSTLLRSSEPETAVMPLQAHMSRCPADYEALEHTILLLRRAGQLPEALKLIKQAEQTDRRYSASAGYHYCKGLYHRCSNDVGRAIASFNLARRDTRWAAVSLIQMIELYLNPDQEGAWEEKENGPVDDVTRQQIAAAEELLKELKPLVENPHLMTATASKSTKQQQELTAQQQELAMRVRVLECYCLLATRNKVSVDRAMQTFAELLDANQEYLPAVLGMATGFMVEKNPHKARNLLKRIGKMEPQALTQGFADDFEKANLLLAKFYIDKGKSDSAQEVCKKALLQNKSCAAAWELLGLGFEKDGNFDLAADSYLKAWALEAEASAPIGFKLAFCLLGRGRLVESIDVCEAVLRQYPDYPRIREEILLKALVCLRSSNTPAV